MPGSDVPVVVLVDDATGMVVARVEARVVDITLIGALARIQLLARRQGRRVHVRDASPELRGLLELAGLAGVIRLEPLREPEGGEDLRVEEVMEARDPSA
jgi:anti-anti-sigma regulatory factor